MNKTKKAPGQTGAGVHPATAIMYRYRYIVTEMSPFSNKEVKSLGDRRMISKKIITKTNFLKMPLSSRCLYFYLVAYADDDGVVEAYAVMQICKASEDDLRILHARQFVFVLNEELVTFISNWREINTLRADRKIDSIYVDLLREKLPDEKILERKDRSDTKKNKKKSVGDEILDGPWTAQDNLIQVNSNQQKKIEEKENQSFSHLSKGTTDSDVKMDGIKEREAIRSVIADNIDLSSLQDIAKRQGESEECMVGEVFDTICEMVIYPRENVRIRDINIPWETVKSQFMKLRFVHVSNILNRIIDKDLNIKNMHAYLVSALYTETLCGTLSEQAGLHDNYLKGLRGEPYYL